jgi:hypothetical protein
MNNKKDLAIAYRIYPGVSKTPPVFHDDKYKLSELCLYSFKKALGDLNVKVFVLLDNCPDNYVDLFKKYFTAEELEIIRYNGIGNAATFSEQIRILEEQNYSEYIYFAEDDYFYLDNGIEKIHRFIVNNNDVSFVSTYYHSDYDTMSLHKEFKSQYLNFEGINFKSVCSTTLTFLTTKTFLSETKNVFLTYLKKNTDAGIWLSLTGHKVKNPLNIIKYLFTNKLWFKILLKSWIFTGKQIFFGKKRNLYIPEISLSTHMDSKCLAPGLDWKKIFSDVQEKIFK